MYGHLMRTRFTTEQVAAVAAVLEIDLEDEAFTLDMFGEAWTSSWSTARVIRTNVTNDDPVLTGKIALAHLREMPNYYTRLDVMEHGA